MPYCTDKEFKALERSGKLRLKDEPAKPKRRKVAPKAPAVTGQIRHGWLLRLAVVLPIHTVSEMNNSDHWAEYGRRNKAQQSEIKQSLQHLFKFFNVTLPVVVRLTRIGAKALDSDNLTSSLKHTRDAIASLIGVDDGSDMIRFEYDQVVDRLAGYGVKIEILRPFEAEGAIHG